jgi:hypothetical protein
MAATQHLTPAIVMYKNLEKSYPWKALKNSKITRTLQTRFD